MTRNCFFVGAIVDQPTNGFIHTNGFENTNSAPEAGIVALIAAAGLVNDGTRGNPEQRCQRRSCGFRAPAFAAQTSHQALRDNSAQGRSQQEWLNLHVAHSCDCSDGIIGVNRRQHEVSCQRSLDRDLCSFAIANFADHHDIWILPQYRTQSGGKRKAHLCIDLRLTDPVHCIFYRVFDCKDVTAAIVEQSQTPIERRCLSTTRRAGDENNSIWLRKGVAQQCVRFR